MSALKPDPPSERTAALPQLSRFESVWRILRYAVIRAAVLLVVVMVSLYLTIMVARLGGPIEDEISGNQFTGWLAGIWEPAGAHASQENVQEPEWSRNLRLLVNGITLNLGETDRMWSYSVSGRIQMKVSELILDRLTVTLLIFGTANVLLFAISVSMALILSRQYGSWLDRLMVSLAPLSTAPAWFFGILLTVFAAQVFHFYVGGMFQFPDEFKVSYIPYILRHMALPVAAIFLSKVFQSIYAWRTFFLIYSSEDFVELARAKGLPPRVIERRYIFRPLLPGLLTSFAMLVFSIWQEAIIMELFFNVAGIGHLFYRALQIKDMPLVVGLAVIFAYLLAIILFLLDVFYAAIDPRVKIGTESQVGPVRQSWRFRLNRLRRRLTQDKQPALKLRPIQPIGPGTIDAPIKETSRPRFVLRFALRDFLKQIVRYPTAVVGAVLIMILLVLSIVTLVTIPLPEAVVKWNGYDNAWIYNPQRAPPAWTNLFRRQDLPETIVFSTVPDQLEGKTSGIKIGQASKTHQVLSEVTSEVLISIPFEYQYDVPPQDVILKFYGHYDEKKPFVELYWVLPNGTTLEVGDFSLTSNLTYHVSADGEFKPPVEIDLLELFTDPNSPESGVLRGSYELRIVGLVFEPGADIDVEFISYGLVHGLAGTDHRRRDLSLALLWGMPIALTFGLVGAVGTTLVTIVIAGTGTWFGGWLDALIQRTTEMSMLLPAFPILLLVYIFVSKSFWIILGVMILLNIFGSAVKNYRAVFLQIRESPYIEAAVSYGASSWRIIFKYLIPRIMSVMIPQLVILIPSYVYLEATLAYLNMSDPLLPTWGKIIKDALQEGGLRGGSYHWVLEPTILLFLTGYAFLMLGFALERVFEPRLRDM